MKILWLPHAPLRPGRTRGEHFIERLAPHHQVRVLSYRTHPPGSEWRYAADLFARETRRTAGHTEIPVPRFPRLGRVNEWILNRAIRHEIATHGCDVFVSSPVVHIAGYIDFEQIRPHAAILCDYLDGGDWSEGQDPQHIERHWVREADAVLCVSRRLTDQARTLNSYSHYLPNGVDLKRYRQFRAAHGARECKVMLGIDPEAFVVSIIGMTCSPRLYFIDAALELARRGLKIVLLLVGDSPLLPAIRDRARTPSDIVRVIGQVPYEAVLPYFMASDVGLNVVDDDPYFHLQSPLKIFEYAALDKPVVVAPWLDEVARSKLTNVTFCEDNAVSLADTLMRLHAGGASTIEVDLDRYDWDKLTAELEGILATTVERVALQNSTARTARTAGDTMRLRQG